MVTTIAQHVELIAGYFASIDEHEDRLIEAGPDAAVAWVAHENKIASESASCRCNPCAGCAQFAPACSEFRVKAHTVRIRLAEESFIDDDFIAGWP